MEKHAKPTQTEPETPYKNPNSPTNTNRKTELQPEKNFSALNVQALIPINIARTNLI